MSGRGRSSGTTSGWRRDGLDPGDVEAGWRSDDAAGEVRDVRDGGGLRRDDPDSDARGVGMAVLMQTRMEA